MAELPTDTVTPWGLLALYRSALEDIRDLRLAANNETQGQVCCRETSRMRKVAEEALAAQAPKEENTETIHILFDGPPGPKSGRFVEVENDDGESIGAGDWNEREDGLWDLTIKLASQEETPATESRGGTAEGGSRPTVSLVGQNEAQRLIAGGRLLTRLDKVMEGCANREDLMTVDADLLLDLRTLLDDELTELERQLAGLYQREPTVEREGARELLEEIRDSTTDEGAVLRIMARDFLASQAPVQTRRPNIICLCGSSRFIAVMAVLAWKLEKKGNIVLSLHLLPSWYTTNRDHQAEHEGVAEFMDEVHLRKIDLADEVIVVDVDGYIGDSTISEIQYANGARIPLRYLSKDADLIEQVFGTAAQLVKWRDQHTRSKDED